MHNLIDTDESFAVFPFFPPVKAQISGSNLIVELPLGHIAINNDDLVDTFPQSDTDISIAVDLLAQARAAITDDEEEQLRRAINIWKILLDLVATSGLISVVPGTVWEYAIAGSNIVAGDALIITGFTSGYPVMVPTSQSFRAVHAIAHMDISAGVLDLVTIKGKADVKTTGTIAYGNRLGSTTTAGTLTPMLESSLALGLSIFTTPPTGDRAIGMASGRGVMALGPAVSGKAPAYIG